MQRYIFVRLFQALVTLFVMSIVVFLLARLTGDPLHLMLPADAKPEDYERARIELGLDQPLPVQYWVFISHAVRGDLGESLRMRIPVTELIGTRLPRSLALGGVAMVIALLVAVPLGVLSAVKRGTFIDTVAKVFAFLGMSMPMFWLGIVLIFVFSVMLNLLPSYGMGGPSHYILPAITLGWFVGASIMRLVRSTMLDVLGSEYVKMARIKGLPEHIVIWKHAFRNALIPPLTMAGFYFILLIATAVIVETVFAWPGMGMLAYDAVIWRDYPLIQGVVLVIAAMMIFANLLVDMLYAYIDPRIRYR
ncbi:MAG: ABC transporter permease [Dehalococcoidia bacterium]|nr:ABC transporter permease [Dehalococcoidia bacterium]